MEGEEGLQGQTPNEDNPRKRKVKIRVEKFLSGEELISKELDVHERKICVFYIKGELTKEDFGEVFERFGAVENAYLIYYKEKTKKAYGFVTFVHKEAARLALEAGIVKILGSTAVIKPFKMNSKKMAHAVKGANSGGAKEDPKKIQDKDKARVHKRSSKVGPRNNPQNDSWSKKSPEKTRNRSSKKKHSGQSSSKNKSVRRQRRHKERLFDNTAREDQANPKKFSAGRRDKSGAKAISGEEGRSSDPKNPSKSSKKIEKGGYGPGSRQEQEQIDPRDFGFPSQNPRKPPKPFEPNRRNLYQPDTYPTTQLSFQRIPQSGYQDRPHHPIFSKQQEPSYYYSTKRSQNLVKQRRSGPQNPFQNNFNQKRRENRKSQDVQNPAGREDFHQPSKYRQNELKRDSKVAPQNFDNTQYSSKNKNSKRPNNQTYFTSEYQKPHSHRVDLYNQNDLQRQDPSNLRSKNFGNFWNQKSAIYAKSRSIEGQSENYSTAVYQETQDENNFYLRGRQGQRARPLDLVEEEIEAEPFRDYQFDAAKQRDLNYSDFEFDRGRGLEARFISGNSGPRSDFRADPMEFIPERHNYSKFQHKGRFSDLGPIYEEEEGGESRDWRGGGFNQSQQQESDFYHYSDFSRDRDRLSTSNQFYFYKEQRLAEGQIEYEQAHNRAPWKPNQQEFFHSKNNQKDPKNTPSVVQQRRPWLPVAKDHQNNPKTTRSRVYEPLQSNPAKFDKMEYLDDRDVLQAKRLPQAIKALSEVSENHFRKNLKFFVKFFVTKSTEAERPNY